MIPSFALVVFAVLRHHTLTDTRRQSFTRGHWTWRWEQVSVWSRYGVVGLTKTAALAYAKQGIRVNCVCPGVIRTPRMERIRTRTPGLEQQYIGAPIGRLGRPEEIAESVVWLCSNAASFVTGHTMTVDGGYVAQ
jgi:NAD(P)-dependent dehydrogenase (short-subunit alcohol dehydrogenase family)